MSLGLRGRGQKHSLKYWKCRVLTETRQTGECQVHLSHLDSQGVKNKENKRMHEGGGGQKKEREKTNER